MYKVVCLDERAAQPEYDVVKAGDEFHRPVATFYKKKHAEDYAELANWAVHTDIDYWPYIRERF